MISRRYAGLIGLALMLALVLTAIHGYLGLTADDHRRVADLPVPLDGLRQVPGVRARSQNWADRKFSTRDWQERTYATPDGQVRLSVARTFDAKSVYHHPELAVAYDTSFLHASVQRLAAMPDVPVHVLRSSADGRSGKVALYALHYGDGFAENPLWFQVRMAAGSLVGGRKPMTLFFVTADDPGRSSLDGTWAARVLQGAIDRFLTMPTPGETAQAPAQ